MPDDMRVALGLRYAEPVSGRRRFGAPAPVDGLERVADGDFGPAAWQPPHPEFPMGDDCLTLNVWAPRSPHSLPVLIWIHGGGFIGGTARQPELDGADLASAIGAVVVAIQYRLGAWGFLDLSAQVDGAVSNAGLRDALAAIDWVRRNIAEFGGDPDRIVINGASAGAGVVGALLATASMSDVVAGAIMQSPPLATVQSAPHAALDAARFVEILGGDPVEASPDALLAAQHELSLEVARERPGTLAMSPVVDGDMLLDSPERVLAAGAGAPIPVLGMWNTDEGTAFRDDPVIRTDADGLQGLTSRTASELRLVEPEWPDDASRMRVATDAYFSGPLRRALAGHAAVAPSWLARFDHRTAVLDELGLGASHSAEGPFLFGNLDRAAWAMIAPDGPSDGDLRVMRDVRAAWAGFLRDGDPGWARVAPGAESPEHVFR